MNRAAARVLLVGLAGLVVACAPLQASMTLPNPARTKDHIEARQTYEVGPYKENHRYEAALVAWSPESVRFAIRLVNSSDECADPASFTFTLLDEAGREHAFKPLGAPVRTTAKGYKDAVLKDTTLTGEFPVAVKPETRAVLLRIRQRPNHFCKDVDFRWEFAP